MRGGLVTMYVRNKNCIDFKLPTAEGLTMFMYIFFLKLYMRMGYKPHGKDGTGTHLSRGIRSKNLLTIKIQTASIVNISLT